MTGPVLGHHGEAPAVTWCWPQRWTLEAAAKMVSSATFEPKPGIGNQIIPARNGGRNSPTVPRMQTMMNSQRNILSITMATYFQSSFTCRWSGLSDRG